MSKKDLLGGGPRKSLLDATPRASLVGGPKRDLTRPQPQAAPDPLADVEYPGDVQGDFEAETGALRTSFMERMKAEQDTKRAALDSEHWFCVCFMTREQKDAFLNATGWTVMGDKYIDGNELADVMKIELPAGEIKFRKAKPDKQWDELSLPLK